jgi:glycosyltransferase involved in cell wall biosynthesis
MRHLHFTQSLEPLNGGGLGASAAALHQEFLAQGASSTLCATYGDTPPLSTGNTVQFRRFRPDLLYFAPDLMRRGAALVAQADIVHGHGLYVGTNLIFGKEARRQGKMLVYHVHGFFEPWILNRSRWKKRLAHWLFEDSNFREVRLWRALTGREADQIRASGVRAPIVVAPNGVDLSGFPVERDQNQPRRRRKLLFLGRIHAKKGLDLLIPAWAALKSERADWELVLAGPGERAYRCFVESLVRAHGVGDSVRLIGPITGQAKIQQLSESELFILPSYSEGFSVAILEALAAGLPVILTTACNFPTIGPSGAGWECTPDQESVTRVLRLALTASDLERWQRGRVGRHLVETQFTWPFIAGIILDACRSYCH